MGNRPNRITEWRERRDLTIEALAEKINISPGYLSRMERGERNVSVKTLTEIARVLAVRPADLVLSSDDSGVMIDDEAKKRVALPIFDDESGRRERGVHRDQLKPDVEPGKSLGTSEGLSGFFPRTSEIPVLESRPGSWPEMIVSEEPSDMMERPDKMIIGKKASAFALVISSNNMGPAIEPGNLVIVNESRHPLPGDDALFCSGRGSGQFRAIAARLLRETAHDWHVRYFEPQSPTESAKILSKENWPSAYRISAKISL
jgi:transcriptional regulator with XRE-family HTH domain